MWSCIARLKFLLFLSHTAIGACGATASNKDADPNIVLILTDDQDVWLDGMEPLKKTKDLLIKNGMTFMNTFVSSPLCCPSRASILTGRYVHNHHTVNNSLSGGCSNRYWQQNMEHSTFVNYLKPNAYTTFFSGKYLNQYGDHSVGGVSHIPQGWDDWNALVGNSKYYNYTISNNGRAEFHADNPERDYYTNVIRNKAIKFIKDHGQRGAPFFMMLSTPAPHQPFTPDKKYMNKFNDVRAPRNGSFNKPPGKRKHWLLRQTNDKPLHPNTVRMIDDFFRNRWRTLLSVDDLVEDVITTLDNSQLLHNTYVIYTSDNGYHLGQFRLPYDKRQLYEFDIRVPLSVRGPNIKPGSISEVLAMNIDLSATILDLAGVPVPSSMDGVSLKPVLFGEKVRWSRNSAIIEHTGEGHFKPVPGCPQYGNHSGLENCYKCVCEDSFNNTYQCVRTLTPDLTANHIVCAFNDTEHFVEAYNLLSDRDEFDNLAASLSHHHRRYVHERITSLRRCQGERCHSLHDYL